MNVFEHPQIAGLGLLAPVERPGETPETARSVTRRSAPGPVAYAWEARPGASHRRRTSCHTAQ
jgi:hypothetical protein